MSYVPNYMQTPPENRQAPEYVPIYPNPVTAESAFTQPETFVAEFPTVPNAPPMESAYTSSTQASSVAGERRPEGAVHILPETLVTGAVNVASSAINTARSVINMIRPQEVCRIASYCFLLFVSCYSSFGYSEFKKITS